MPNPTPIPVWSQLEGLQALFEQWEGRGQGTVVKVLENMRHLWEELYAVDARPKILIVWVSEVARGTFQSQDYLHRVDRTFNVVLVRGKGFAEPSGRQVPFPEWCEGARDRIRVCTSLSDDDERLVNYRSMRPLPNVLTTPQANAFADAQVIEFTTGNEIYGVTTVAPSAEGQSGDEIDAGTGA